MKAFLTSRQIQFKKTVEIKVIGIYQTDKQSELKFDERKQKKTKGYRWVLNFPLVWPGWDRENQ